MTNAWLPETEIPRYDVSVTRRPLARTPGDTTDEAWSRARQILCLRLDSLGDVLMTTPAIRALRDSAPGRRITLLTSPAGAPVAALVPEIDDVIVYEAPWMKSTPPRHDARHDQQMIQALAGRRFDAAVIFTVYSQNPLPAALLCYLADIPLRLAYCHENPYRLLTHWVPDPEPEQLVRHEVRRQLDLVANVGCHTADESLAIHIPEPARRRARAVLAELAIDPASPWVIVHPGATAPSRRYPPESYAVVARTLASEHHWTVAFTGSAPEHDLVEGIRAAMDVPSRSLVGRLDLPDLAALLQLAPLLIANNTGPAHLAAAVGTPVVSLYALTNPQHTPWGVPSRVLSHDVPCKNCYRSICPEGHHNCLRLVTPQSVVRAALGLIGATSPLPLEEGQGEDSSRPSRL